MMAAIEGIKKEKRVHQPSKVPRLLYAFALHYKILVCHSIQQCGSGMVNIPKKLKRY
jgi:hypothetical protein